jgi:hypothetical protein
MIGMKPMGAKRVRTARSPCCRMKAERQQRRQQRRRKQGGEGQTLMSVIGQLRTRAASKLRIGRQATLATEHC